MAHFDEHPDLGSGVPDTAQHSPSFPGVEVGENFSSNLEPTLVAVLKELGFARAIHLKAGLLFWSEKSGTQVIVDLGICRRKDLQYIDYTLGQNQLMNACSRTLRSAVECPDDTSDLAEEIEHFLLERESDRPYSPQKGGRDLSNPDPSKPGKCFESTFSEAFGNSALHALRREQPFLDFAKSTRYIDYALLTRNGPNAIELNGRTVEFSGRSPVSETALRSARGALQFGRAE